MKYTYILLLLLCCAKLSSAQSYFIDPGSYFATRGETLQLKVYSGKGFDSVNSKLIPPSQLNSASLYLNSKPVDILSSGKDAKALKLTAENGLFLVTANRELLIDNIEREEVMRQLSDEGFSDLVTKADDKEELNLKNIFNLKTLMVASKPGGGVYSEVTGQELEIVPQQNPYKMKYGEDVTLLVLFKGKPLAKSRVEIYVRTINGSVIPSESITDRDGKIYLKLNRAGDWLLRTVNIEHTDNPDGKGADYIRWFSALTFGFKQ